MNSTLFTNLYLSRNLGNGESWPLLRQCCQHAGECWDGVADADESVISRPWVGSKYEQLRLVVIGVNFNGGGGIDYAEYLVNSAKQQIRQGMRRTLSQPGYQGTNLWFYAACYAALFARRSDLMTFDFVDGYPDYRAVGNAFDYIAFLNHIKCSPANENARPTRAMWNRCGSHLLVRELLLLEPSKILFLGFENYRMFETSVLGRVPAAPSVLPMVIRTSIPLGELGDIPSYAVVHPRSGSAYVQLEEAASLARV